MDIFLSDSVSEDHLADHTMKAYNLNVFAALLILAYASLARADCESLFISCLNTNTDANCELQLDVCNQGGGLNTPG